MHDDGARRCIWQAGGVSGVWRGECRFMPFLPWQRQRITGAGGIRRSRLRAARDAGMETPETVFIAPDAVDVTILHRLTAVRDDRRLWGREGSDSRHGIGCRGVRI